MLNRVLEKYVKVANDEEDTENADRFELEYYLLESGSIAGILSARTAYGIEIIKEWITDPSREKVRRYLYGQAQDKGTDRRSGCQYGHSVSLPYILDDLLSE